ncbi:MAG: amino acid adenylation domain-containing protein, partial [bacterium]|nr:amino acid adenylation domain-containing protein [bacterium]
AADNQVPLYMAILSIFTLLLSKLSGQEDIIVGTPTAGRRHADLENIIGMFVNTLPMRNYSPGNKTVNTFMKEVKKHTLAAFENQEYQFEDLVDRLSVRRNTGRNPIFDVMFNLLNQADYKEQNTNSFNSFNSPNSLYSPNSFTSKFDLTLNAEETGDHLYFYFEYCTKLFKEKTIKRFITYFKGILRAISNAPHQKISDIEIITEEEKNQILYDFNDTETDYPHDKTIHQLFEEQVEKTPDRISTVGKAKPVGSRQYAVGKKKTQEQLPQMEATPSIPSIPSFPSIPSTHETPLQESQSRQATAVTYRELNEKSNRLAGLLKSKGVQPGTIVAIMPERSIEMIIGIIGILKAGAAYLPIDPEYPEERIKYMLRDSSTKIVLRELKEFNELGEGIEIIDIHTIYQLFSSTETRHSALGIRHPASALPTSSPAYIIYTSGTTGRPKGVLIEHSSVVNLAISQVKRFKLDTSERIMQFSSISFDASVEQIVISLFSGAVLVLVDKETLTGGEKFNDYVNKQAVTHLNSVPSFLATLEPAQNRQLRRVIAGGEKCPPELVGRWISQCDFYNQYGPTETTVTSIALAVKKNNVPTTLSIGKPIANTRVFILDKNRKLVPAGVTGELYIGGSGVAPGYLNKPEMTSEKFITYKLQNEPEKGSQSQLPGTALQIKAFGGVGPTQWGFINPSVTGFSRKGSDPPEARVFRTGDLARWLPDGNVEYLGRIDHQVKVRGFRIELGEIESRLLTQPGIKEAIVISRQSKEGGNILCAYYVESKTIQSESGIRIGLSQYVPQYMLPSFFIKLAKLPLAPNGKVDRNALPAPEIKGGSDYEAPVGQVEEALAAVWQHVLNIDGIGVTDDYFNLGGDSIKTIQIAARLRKYRLKLEVKDMFAHQTIKQLAPHVKKISRSSRQDTVEGTVPLTPIQQWFLQSSLTDIHHFNQTLLIYREEGFDESILEKIFSKIIRHHDALRMVYEGKTKKDITAIRGADTRITDTRVTDTRDTGTTITDTDNDNRADDETTIVQRNRGIEGELFHLEVFDFKNLTEKNIKKRIPMEASRLQAGMDLKTGPLVKLG